MAKNRIITAPFHNAWKIMAGKMDLSLRARKIIITDQSKQYRLNRIEGLCIMINPRVSNSARRSHKRDLGNSLVISIGQRKANSWITGLRDTANRMEGMVIVFDNDSSIAQGGTISPVV